mmetsp:Transcript_22104/g.48075  ORF Transcript_22104/g.48075 Transcript_22104/m.48075 type:complete len:1157 (+) Transcript_22104:574-4044(+)
MQKNTSSVFHDAKKPTEAADADAEEASEKPKPRIERQQLANNIASSGQEAEKEVKSKSEVAEMAGKQQQNVNGNMNEGIAKQQRDLSPNLKRTASDMNAADTSEDDDIPMAVPVEGDHGEEIAEAVVTATIVNEDGDAKASSTQPNKEAGKKDSKKLKRLNSETSTTASSSTANNKKGKKKSKTGTTRTKTQGKSYQGSYRSAAAAHRHRQIPIPPIGSPGLLMLPTAANTASFPPLANSSEDGVNEEEERKKWFVKVDSTEMGKNVDYLLPSTVFRQSMIAGGYTLEKRTAESKSADENNDANENSEGSRLLITIPHRGSSTERNVGDMFDSDAGGLYLHFPELIPRSVWERRLGDEVDYSHDNVRPPRQEAGGGSPGKSKKEKGTETASSANGTASSNSNKKEESKKEETKNKGPKGARSSYIFFTNAQRPLMVSQFPGMRFTEQGVIMGERWRALTPEEKKPFEEMAIKDKERYGREMAEYIESVKREMRDEKLGKKDGDGVKVESSSVTVKEEQVALAKEEQKEGCEGIQAKESTKEEPPKQKRKSEIKGPRLVDAMILSLSKMLGEKVHRKLEVKPETVSSSAVKPEQVTSGVKAADTETPPPPPRHVSPDLTLDELPQFTNHTSQPQTRSHSRSHAPPSFLDMMPISLTATYPSTYISKRRAYAKAVQIREDAIIDAQEAKDDAEDAHEKYVAHCEAWERMLEYQRGVISKREAERKKQRQKEREMVAREAAERKERKESEGEAKSDILEAVTETAAAGSGGEDKKEIPSADETAKDGSSNASASEKPPRPSNPPPEDPMDCMPPRPQPPGPTRVVLIPDIPIPPIPPPVDEIVEGNHEETDKNGNQKVETTRKIGSAAVIPMHVPKLNPKLLQHLDPSCFLPTMSGRYLGLLSNHISDPQFNGIHAPGIAGNTFGGGTGLATSYAGGGRGAVGLVGGPSRGGSNLWQTSNGEKRSSSTKERAESVDDKVQPKRRLSSTTKDKTEKPEEVTSNKAADSVSVSVLTKDVVASTQSDAPLPTQPASAKKKRPATDITTSSSSLKSPIETTAKKQKRASAFSLATGDRNTSASEIASGSAGPEFPDGWIIKTYRRSGGETIGKTDRFWFSPGRNIRFRAKKHAKAFCEILKEASVGGDEDEAAEIYRARGLHF